MKDDWLDAYDVTWTAQSANAGESMPCGGGDVGLNVWVERGDLLIYLAKSGTFDELNGMPKLGRLRVTLEPNPLVDVTAFEQRLRLSTGRVEIVGEANGVRARLTIWVDVFTSVVHVDVESDVPTHATAAFECWRLTRREQVGGERQSNRSWLGAPAKPLVRPDLVEYRGDAVRFVHRNESSDGFDLIVNQQELGDLRASLWNPLENLTFGGEMTGDDMVADEPHDDRYASTAFRAWPIVSREPRTRHAIRVASHVAQTSTIDDWHAQLNAIPTDGDGAASLAWWREFWARSGVVINSLDPSSPAWQVGRNYQLFRYQLACNARGQWPTKFNGGLFTVDSEFTEPTLSFPPDFRRWGGGSFTAQNQRLVYWPMLKSGDAEMMRPQFEFYRRALVNAVARTKHYFGIDGATFAEQIENFGLPVGYEWNWKRKPDAPVGVEDNAWVCYQWDTAFEFCRMILDAREYAGFDVAPYVELIEKCLSFYDAFYTRDGVFTLSPATALETYKNATSPSNTIAALHGTLTALLALPAEIAIDRERWSTLLNRLPAIPTREMNGHRVIAPAASWSHIQNCELPQLYPVWPWRLYGVGRPELQLARDTWEHGVENADQKQIQSWHQDAIFCACLGLTDEAARLTVEKMKDSPRRFPTFWGPGHDWVPDHNWGGSGMIGVQEMLLQSVGDKLHVLPAWPRAWDVEFKLHAPGNTIVECTLRNGAIERLVVTPPSRRADVVLPD